MSNTALWNAVGKCECDRSGLPEIRFRGFSREPGLKVAKPVRFNDADAQQNSNLAEYDSMTDLRSDQSPRLLGTSASGPRMPVPVELMSGNPPWACT